MTPGELRALVAEVVREELTAFFGDPDAGLTLRPEFVRLLEERLEGLESGGRTLSLDEAFDFRRPRG